MMLKKIERCIEIYRIDKFVFVKFLIPHRVISTCRVNGGIREDLKGILNHQCCEPNAHFLDFNDLSIKSPDAYLKKLCEFYKISEKCACLETAANMNCASIKSGCFEDLKIVTICTAGIDKNAACAGDPATLYEDRGKFIPLNGSGNIPKGTINIIVCINKGLTPGALVEAVVTATEAKSSFLQELDIPSKYSTKIATGTGTDQIAIASALKRDGVFLTNAGKHTKLGELISISVKESIKEALEMYGGITPLSRCSILSYLERFGTSRENIIKEILKYLNKEDKTIFRENFGAIDRDPVVVSFVAALIHIRDKMEVGIFPKFCVTELFTVYLAHIACAVSGKYNYFDRYIRKINFKVSSTKHIDIMDLICFSIGLGFNYKWERSKL